MRRSISRLHGLLILAIALSALPQVSAHGLITLGIVAPADCPGAGGCLQTVENQPRLHAGETVDLNLYNDDEETHEILVTTNASADPQRRNTSADQALNEPVALPPNTSVSAEELSIPHDAEALYVWCSLDDHEARGEHLVLPLSPPHAPAEDEVGLGLAAPAGLLALLVAAGWLHRRN